MMTDDTHACDDSDEPSLATTYRYHASRPHSAVNGGRMAAISCGGNNDDDDGDDGWDAAAP